MHIGLATRADMAEPDQMPDLMELRPELYCRVRDHLLRFDVVLAVKDGVRAKIYAVLYANDGNRIVGIAGLRAGYDSAVITHESAARSSAIIFLQVGRCLSSASSMVKNAFFFKAATNVGV